MPAPAFLFAGILAAAALGPQCAWAAVGQVGQVGLDAGLPPLLVLAALLAPLGFWLWLRQDDNGLIELIELQNLKEVLLTSRNKLKAVFDSLSDPTVSISPDGQVESVNMAMAETTGVHPRDLVGQHFQESFGELDIPLELKHGSFEVLEKLLATEKKQLILVETPGAEAGPNYFEIHGVPAFDKQEKLNLAIVQIKDVSVLKRMEQAVKRYSETLELEVAERTCDLVAAQEDLQQERDRLAQANQDLLHMEQLKRDLTAMVVHDMKGPLAEVVGNLDMIGFGDLDEMQTEARDLAAMGADDLLRMIMNLLDIDRLEGGRLRVRYGQVEFAELAQSVVHRFSTLIRLKELKVTVSDEGGSPFPGDEDLLSRVVQNLLTNALSHTDEGGQIALSSVRGQDGGVVIRVADNGHGIPKRYHGTIFEKFTQASSGKNPRTSTGLGLTFCQMAVEAHGGRIWFESTEGQGATFFVWLPGEEPDPESV